MAIVTRPPHPCLHSKGAANLAAKTIPLRTDWDRQPRLGDNRGHHVARADVDRALADFIERRSEGALLVVGHRGSGKTSSVVAAANRAAGLEGQDRTVVPIMITATSMDKANAEDHKTLLRSLIWALHRRADGIEGIDKKLRRRTESLYLNATASVKTVETSQSKTQSLALGGHTAAGAAAGMALAVLAYHGAIDLGLTVAPAVLAPLIAKIVWDWRASKSTTHLYRRDYGFADMQHDFEDLLRKYGNTYKIVFILDEFDKDGDFASMIRPLKMLLNQGDAAYVVITAPKEAQKLMIKRDVNYTLFSEVLFINRPLFREMEKFIDEVVGTGGKETIPAPEYDDFKCYMRYKSQTDFFNLYGALRDRRAGVDTEGRPLVTVSLNEQEATEANLQRSIEYLYDRKAYGAQSKQMTNDGMLDAMYETVARAEAQHGKTVAVDDERAHVTKKLAEYTPDAASAVRDLFSLLHKQGYLAKEGEGQYRIVGRLAGFDPAGIFVEEEEAFRAAYDAALGALANFANVQNKLVDGRSEAFLRGSLDSRLDDMIRVAGSIVAIDIPGKARHCRALLRRPQRPILDPDKLREYTDGARATLDTLRTHTVDLFSRALERKGFPPARYDYIPSDLTALDFARDQQIHTAFHQWNSGRDHDNDDDGISITILPIANASFISKIRSGATSKLYPLREIYIVLVGDVEPVGLHDSSIPIGLIRSKGRDGDGDGDIALDMARKQSTYILAVASPPNAKTVEAVASVVKLIVAKLESNKKKNFGKFWTALLRAAGTAGGKLPSRGEPARSSEGGAGRQRTAATRRGHAARDPLGGDPR